jgi:alcohol dehydrogenase class IV
LGSSDAMASRNLRNGLIRLRSELGLPSTLLQAGVDRNALRQKMPALIASAMADPCCKTNPVPVEDFMVRQILEEVTGSG